jgi:hypothetical protein
VIQFINEEGFCTLSNEDDAHRVLAPSERELVVLTYNHNGELLLRSQSYEAIEDFTMPSESGSFIVATAEGGFDVSFALPLPETAPEHLDLITTMDPVLKDLDFNFDNSQTPKKRVQDLVLDYIQPYIEKQIIHNEANAFVCASKEAADNFVVNLEAVSDVPNIREALGERWIEEVFSY